MDEEKAVESVNVNSVHIDQKNLDPGIGFADKGVSFEWNLPNVLTLFRFFLVPWQVYFLVIGEPFWAFVFYFIAGVSDLADGYLARKLQCRTISGAMLDPLADKVTIMAMFFTLIYLAIIPLWFAVLIIFRDFIILLGVSILLLTKRRVPFSPIQNSSITLIVLNGIRFDD